MFTSSTKTKNIWMIIASFFVALILVYLRLPGWMDWLCPQWIVLAVLCWVLLDPQIVNVGVAWGSGILLDVLYGSPLGEHAFALVLATYFLLKIKEKVEWLGYGIEMVIIFALIVWCQLLPLLMQFMFLDKAINFLPIFSRSLISVLIWFLAMLLFDSRGKIYLENRHK